MAAHADDASVQELGARALALALRTQFFSYMTFAYTGPGLCRSQENIDLNLTPKGFGRATFNGQGKIQSVAEKVTTEAIRLVNAVARHECV